MEEIIDIIKEAANEKDLHIAGNEMRAFLETCDSKSDRDKILSVWQSKSVRMINPKRITSNY